MSSKKYFSNKRVWITGASSGIGKEVALQLADVTSQLIISGRNTETLEALRVHCKFPEKVMVVVMDQSSPESVQQACDMVFSGRDTVDVVFCNGGVSQRALSLDTSEEVERHIFETNYFSQIQIAKRAAQSMDSSKGLHLVVTSSLLGKWGFPLRSSYAASKHALHGYFDSLRMETKESGLRITLVLPGFINTPISKNAMIEDGTLSATMDTNQADGISAFSCAQKIVAGVAAGKKEFSVGGKETLGLLFRRFVPQWFDKMLQRKNPR